MQNTGGNVLTAYNAAIHIARAQEIIACNGGNSKAIKHLQQVQIEKKQLTFQLVSLKERVLKSPKGMWTGRMFRLPPAQTEHNA